jgi:hypothetical protein
MPCWSGPVRRCWPKPTACRPTPRSDGSKQTTSARRCAGRRASLHSAYARCDDRRAFLSVVDQPEFEPAPNQVTGFGLPDLGAHRTSANLLWYL